MLHNLSPENLRLLYFAVCLGSLITIVAIFLALLVRYTVFFALLGAAGVVGSVTLLPRSMISQYASTVLASGFALFILMVLVYELVQWRRHQRMLEVRARFWSLGWKSGPSARRTTARGQQRSRRC